MELLNSLKSRLESYEKPFTHWAINKPLTDDAIKEICNADIANPVSEGISYDGTRAIDGGEGKFREGIKSGGKAKKLASDAFVIYPSGRAKKIGFLKNPKIYPGSEIFVSFKEIEEDKENGRFFDRFTTIFSVLTGALTTVVLAKQLSN